METNAVNTSNIPNLNSVSQNSASNVGAPLKNSANTASSPTSNILQSSITLSKGELAQNLKKVNDGIMITSMVDKGLQKQSEILRDIKSELQDKLQDYKIDIDKNQLKDDVLKKMDQFIDLANNLKYNGDSLLDSSANPKIEINTMSETIEVSVPSTKEIGAELTSIISRADFVNQNLNSIIAKIDDSLQRMNNSREEFTQTQKQLIETAKSTIADQSRDAMEKSQVQNRNYGVEVSEFSKANVNAVAGHLVAAQANIPQSHGMRLLY